MPTKEQHEQAKQVLLDALSRALGAKVPERVATLPRVTELQIHRQWTDTDTGYLMAEGVAIFADGREIRGDLGRLVPVWQDGVVVGYKLATLHGQTLPFGQTTCDTPGSTMDNNTDTEVEL